MGDSEALKDVRHGKVLHTDATEIHVRSDVTIMTGGGPLTIQKLYGPNIACDLRIRCADGCWVIERERTKKVGTVPADAPERQYLPTESTFEEVARFDYQESLDFGDDDE